MHHQEAAPPAELQAAIKCFWHTRLNFAALPATFEVVPDGYAEIIFCFGSSCSIAQPGGWQQLPSPFLMGLLGQPAVFRAENQLEVIGIRCFPWTVFELLGLPPGPSGVRVLAHPIARLQTTLAPLVQAGRVADALAEAARYFLKAQLAAPNQLLTKAGGAMQQAHGTLPVRAVAAAAHATVRTLERRFKQAAGHTVKDVSGLMRFEQVRNHLWHHPAANLAGLAHELGYTDQAHLSREFRRYSGTTPAAFARQARRLRPPGPQPAGHERPRFYRICTSLTPARAGILCHHLRRGKRLLKRMESAENQSYEVIVAGAGPVGLFLAGELAQAGCSVLVLEKAEGPLSTLKQLPFGIRGLNALSVEALDRRGLLGELELHKRLQNPHQHAVQGPRRQVGHFAGLPLHESDLDPSQWPYRLPGSPPPSLLSELAELETVLTRRAEGLGATIRRGLGIVGFAQADDAVTVQAGDQTYRTQWLVGCDGSRSVVRKAGGFEFAGTEPEFTGYTTRLELADPEKLGFGRQMTPAGMYLQSQPGYVVIQEFDGGAFHKTGQPATLAHVQAVLRRVSGTDVTVSALHLATTWTDRARQATAYRHGRVLLAGDAAHIHAPLGGQGLNLGLGDALNLGWKLAATLHGRAPAGLLDTYFTERHPVGAQVLDWSRAQVALMRPDPGTRALNAVVRDLLNTPDGATYTAGRVWGIATRYDLGSTHPLTGRSVPNFELAAGPTMGELLRAGQGLLLDFEASAALAAWASSYGGQLQYVAGQAKDQLGLRAVLVRPDGIVAWASDHAPAMAELQQAADRWFAKG